MMKINDFTWCRITWDYFRWSVFLGWRWFRLKNWDVANFQNGCRFVQQLDLKPFPTRLRLDLRQFVIGLSTCCLPGFPFRDWDAGTCRFWSFMNIYTSKMFKAFNFWVLHVQHDRIISPFIPIISHDFSTFPTTLASNTGYTIPFLVREFGLRSKFSMFWLFFFPSFFITFH